jgi:phage protein D
VATKVEQRVVAQIYVTVDGSPLTQGLLDDLTKAVVDSSVHLPDMAVLEFGNMHLRWSEDERFRVGQELRIELGRQDLKREVFSGEITSVELEISMAGTTPLTIRAYDRAHRLHRGRFTRSFTNMKDSDIAKKIADDLSFDKDVQETTEVHEYVLQNNQTNWEFLQERATRLGFELQVHGKTLVFKPPPSTPAEPIDLAWKDELLSFQARMTASEQVGKVEVRGWDPLNKKEVVGRASRPRRTPQIGEKRTGGKVAADAFRRDAAVVVAREPIYSQVQADALAQTVLDELANFFVTAEGAAMGDPVIRLGSEVNVKHVGKQFSGKYLVTEIRHLYEPEGYRIEFKVTGRRSTDLVSLLAPPAPFRTHILTGIVSNNKDPRDASRVKVKMPLLGQDIESHWCRVVAPGAGPERGLEYLPEVDDEVLVIGHDINHLYVLGGLWSLHDVPPGKNSQAVSGGRVAKRIIKSRTGHVVLLDDSDSGGGITIVDSTEKNKIVIDTAKNSLEMTVEGDVKLKAGGSLEIVAGTEAKIQAGTSLKAEAGTDASIEAMTQLELKGAIGAKLQSNAKADVTAPMVNIGP